MRLLMRRALLSFSNTPHACKCRRTRMFALCDELDSAPYRTCCISLSLTSHKCLTLLCVSTPARCLTHLALTLPACPAKQQRSRVTTCMHHEGCSHSQSSRFNPDTCTWSSLTRLPALLLVAQQLCFDCGLRSTVNPNRGGVFGTSSACITACISACNQMMIAALINLDCSTDCSLIT